MGPGRALFDEFLDLDASERAKRLESLGASAPDLRDAVEALLNADAAADAGLASHARDAHVHAELGWVYAGLGRKVEAIKEAQLGMDLLPVSKDAFFAPLMMHHAAITYMRVGEPDAAIALLERLSTMPHYLGLSAPELRLDPLWDPLRNHPSFRQLVESGAG